MTSFTKRWTKLWVNVACIAVMALSLGTALADDGPEHRTRQNRPIQLGTSGGSIEHIDFPFCCGGTLGGLVQGSGGTLYVLSNNHVAARTNRGTPDEGVVQPGLIDVGCAQITNDVVANLTDHIPISSTGTNEVDAAIAQTDGSLVANSGNILDIGALSSNTLAAFAGLNVQKSGRTTGHTHGQVQAIDVTANVSYSTKCGRRGGFTATFVHQFRVTPAGFSDSGDSGSLVVEDVTTSPRTVGLLFAGDSTSTLGNPISAVLSAFGVAMVGGTPPPPPPSGTVTGTVTDASSGSPVAGATVEVDTGESATTDSTGSYTISGVPTGDRQVTASAPGFEPQSQTATVNDGQPTTVDFSLVPTQPGSSAIVDCIIYETFGGKAGDKHLRITVTVVDDNDNPVAGANVTVSITLPDGSASSSTATTDANGFAVFDMKNAPNGCYSVDVTDVAAAGLSFDGTEPLNGFSKGTDSAPDSDCRIGGDGCHGATSGVTMRGRGMVFIRPHAEKVKAAIAVKRRNEARLFAISKQVIGVGVGAVNGEPVIEVYLASGEPGLVRRLPAMLADFRVRPIITGPFKSLVKCQARR